MEYYDITIIGGGASGLCAAIEAARTNNGARIAVAERLPRVGKKLLATGNGRCNLTNIRASADSYNAPGFAAGALTAFDAQSTVGFFGGLGLLTVADGEGRVYPSSGTAASVLDVLRFEAQRLGVTALCETPVVGIVKTKNSFEVNGAIVAKRLILACGGKASPVHGSDGSGYALLKALGHAVTPVYPSLVQLKTDPSFVKPLKGIRVNANISIEVNGQTAAVSSGEILFTEYGLSGIAAMEVSRAVSGKKNGQSCFAVLDMLPSFSFDAVLACVEGIAGHMPELPVESLLNGLLPKRLGQSVCALVPGVRLSMPVSALSERQIKAIVSEIKSRRVTVTGTNGFNDAQVTAGGAELSEFYPDTMASRLVPGLYACGELLDIDGGCGGYNLQWAWSSGRLAGRSAAESLL